eukprot:IDg10015t1
MNSENEVAGNMQDTTGNRTRNRLSRWVAEQSANPPLADGTSSVAGSSKGGSSKAGPTKVGSSKTRATRSQSSRAAPSSSTGSRRKRAKLS